MHLRQRPKPKERGNRHLSSREKPIGVRSASREPSPERGDKGAHAFRIAVLVALYFASAKLGLSLSVAHGSATPVWAPTGISLAAFLLFGPRLWPGVFLGAFLANATTPVPLWAAAGIAVGNTLEALVGNLLLRRAGFEARLDRVKDVLALVVFGALLSTTLSATIGVTTLAAAKVVPMSEYALHWGVWWSGDAVGDFLVAPLLLTWATVSRGSLRPGVLLEAAGLFAGIVAVAGIAFFPDGSTSASFGLFPLMIWAALRFRQPGVTAAAFIASALAIWATLTGSQAFGGEDATESVAILQALMSVVCISSLILAATISERERAEQELRQKAKTLTRSEMKLAEAQQVAHLGSWEWDISANQVMWSDELFRLFGLQPGEIGVDYEAFVERLHSDDRAMVEGIVEQALTDHRPFAFDHRVRLPDGRIRWLHGRGEVIVDGSAVPVKMVGTAQDISDRKRAEEYERKLHDARVRHRQALELNDNVVQGLVGAAYALDSGDPAATRRIVQGTLASARSIVSELLQEDPGAPELGPGDLVREKPALLNPPIR